MKKVLFGAALSVAAVIVNVSVAHAQFINVVTDPTAEPTWISTLANEIKNGVTMAQQLETAGKSLQTQLQNLRPTTARWGVTSSNALTQIAPLINTANNELADFNARIEQNTGVKPSTNQALQAAQQGVDDLQEDEGDLENAVLASDDADGDLSASQAGHRFDQLAITQQIEQKQFDAAKYIEEQKDEAAAVAWLTGQDGVTNAATQE